MNDSRVVLLTSFYKQYLNKKKEGNSLEFPSLINLIFYYSITIDCLDLEPSFVIVMI